MRVTINNQNSRRNTVCQYQEITARLPSITETMRHTT